MAKKKLAPLAACPFCGGEAQFKTLWIYMKKDKSVGIARLDGEVPWSCVGCKTCGARTAPYARQEAITVWNRRVIG